MLKKDNLGFFQMNPDGAIYLFVLLVVLLMELLKVLLKIKLIILKCNHLFFYFFSEIFKSEFLIDDHIFISFFFMCQIKVILLYR
jgi:hypothetical protein